jgi:uncharacterized membrane protein
VLVALFEVGITVAHAAIYMHLHHAEKLHSKHPANVELTARLRAPELLNVLRSTREQLQIKWHVRFRANVDLSKYCIWR